MDDERKELVSERDLWDILEFSNSVNNLYPSVFTPDLINARMRDMTMMNVGGVTESDVAKALANPKESERELLGISETFEATSSSYRRILDYMVNLPAWDLTYHCKNIKDKSEYKSPKYQKDLDVVKDFLYKLDYKKEFTIALSQMFREETFFSVFRDEGEKYVLQQLPSDYCKITGRWDYSLLFSFNYYWFQQGGVDMDMYPPIFKETFKKLFTDSGGKRVYNPSIDVDMRSLSTWVIWGDASPSDGFWVFKKTPQIASRIPYFTGLFPDLAMQGLIRGLQRSSYIASAAKIIMGEVALLNKEQKATMKDALSISPDLLGKFLQLVKSGINNESIRVASAPLQNLKPIEFQSQNDIYSSYLKTTLGSAGVNSNLLFSGDVKPNAIETQLSANVDEFVSMAVYPQFNAFLEYQINKRTKYYKFGFEFEGSNFYLDRERRLATQMTLLGQGIANPQKIAASIGQNPFVFQAQLDEAKAMGWVDSLTPIVSNIGGNAVGGNKEGEKGRPKKSDSEISESGEQTRTDGGNIGRGGKSA